MALFSRFLNGFRALLRKRRVEQELDDELRAYVEASVEEKVRGGMAPQEAMRAARVEIGSLEAVKDHTRDAGWESRVEALWQDVRYAMRMIRRAPAFTAVVVVTIGMGVGAATSMFAAMRTLLVAPPPHIVSPERVFRLHLMMPSQDPDAEPRVHDRTAYPFYELLADRAESLSAVAAYTRAAFAVGRGADARMAQVEMVSAGFWRAVGARPSLGRFIRDEEAHPATGARVVVLSHTFWRTQFGGSADVIGRSLSIKGQPYEVIGVAPRAFRGLEHAGVDLWLPLFADEDGTGRPATWHRFETSSNLKVVARLRDDVSAVQASAELTTFVRAFLERAYARSGLPGILDRVQRAQVLLGSITGGLGGDLRPLPEARVTMWLVGVAFVLLGIACANVAGLLLLRAIRRQREMAVRLALGVSRGRLACQLLTESSVLALLGGAVAVLVFVWSGTWLRRTILPAATSEPLIAFDPIVVVVAVVSVLGTALLTGIAPLLYTRSDHRVTLRSSGGAGRRPRMLNVLLVVQGALSVVLLVGAGLFVQSLHGAETVDIGLDRDNVLVVEIDFSGTGRSPHDVAAFFERALERTGALPGVAQASLASNVPLRTARAGARIRLPGRDAPGHQVRGPYVNAVTPGFFASTGMRIVQGREFVEQERNRSDVAVINETIARLYWPDRVAVGECMYLSQQDTCTTVVGVVADSHRFNIIEEERYFYYYLPMAVDDEGARALLVRVAPRARGVDAAVRQNLLELDASLPFIKIETLGKVMDPQMQSWRLGASIFTAFGLMALVLAMIGLSSSLAYAVSQRTPEFAVRLALGARPASLVTLMLGDGLRAALVATVAGLVIAGWASRFIAHLLYGVSPHEPAVFTAVAGAILAVSTLASLLPARRVWWIDPAAALRAE